jgi:hypothetical protein
MFYTYGYFRSKLKRSLYIIIQSGREVGNQKENLGVHLIYFIMAEVGCLAVDLWVIYVFS